MVHSMNNIKSMELPLLKKGFMRKSYQKRGFYASILFMKTSRFLGIDYGTKRIGVAVSDESGTLAFPKEIIENDALTFKRLGEIITENNVSEIVVGESVDFSGRLNVLSGRIEILSRNSKRSSIFPSGSKKNS